MTGEAKAKLLPLTKQEQEMAAKRADEWPVGHGYTLRLRNGLG